ncbi:MAG: aminopeptidase P family protein [Clostridia bacterium]|nr:aminopeptidase P family protein [Clostridia bacterium]
MKNKLKKIKENLRDDEAAIICSPSNRFYLTGFASSAGYVVITKQRAVFLIDFRYFEKAKQTVTSCEVLLLKKTFEQINEIIENKNKVFIETDYLSVDDAKRFENELSPNISQDDKLSSILRKMRSVKSEGEIESIKKAQKLTDETFSYILPRIAVGKTEKEIMLDMEFFMRKNGSEGVSFDFIVVSGKNSSLPHGVPTDKKIEHGDFITMDFGAVVNGYRSDMTRTVAVGSVTEEQKKVYNTVLAAQESAIKAAVPGAVCRDIDKVARDIIEKEHKGCFGHGLGHSVGIDIHEGPSFNTRDESVIEKGMVITVEPGIYLENKFGVRIEDMIVITDDGNIDITQSPKELIVL